MGELIQDHTIDECLENDWQNKWNIGDIGFHMSRVNPDLVKYENLMGSNCRIFVPLCGKSLDLVYLADQGHDVYGCEFVTTAVQDFFKEQNLEYTTSALPSAKITVYKATTKKITLYQGDFFSLKSEEIGKFNAIWDRASLVAINPSERNKYVEVMHDIMDPKCKYLLNTLKIEGKKYHGPPHSVLIDDVSNLFSNFCEIKVLDTKLVHFLLKANTITEISFLMSN